MVQKTFSQTKRWALPAVLIIFGLFWLGWAWGQREDETSFGEEPTSVAMLSSGAIASMDSPVFEFGPGWTVSERGADPSEPADPWMEPAGIFTFEYVGTELALELAVGDYWGYIYITVDGQPANLLPAIAGNANSQNQAAAYKTFYEPEKAVAGKSISRWIRVHRTRNSAPDTVAASIHTARVEVWRAWGQTPIRGVAVDALPMPSRPLWPGVLALALAAGIGLWRNKNILIFSPFNLSLPLPPDLPTPISPLPPLFIILILILVISIFFNLWWLCLFALALLAATSLFRPALWIAALLFGLPFYYSITLPVLPGRAMSLIDVGVLGGVMVCFGNWVLGDGSREAAGGSDKVQSNRVMIVWVLFAIMGWALVSLFAADQFGVALREWRVLFLYAVLFAVLLRFAISNSIFGSSVRGDLWLLVGMWLAGGTTVALIGLWQYGSGIGITEAEGVRRIQALYDSPNNLALYLERTLAVSVALALFMRNRRGRWLAVGMALIQGLALLLTFSKGAIFLGLPAMFVALWVGGLVILRQRDESRRTLWWLAAVALVGALALTPFLGTERFQRLFDFSQGTGYLRIQLWRSAWQMALDHPLLGVGPDNFLYAFRSSYILPAAWQEPNLNHPHNFFLDWWTRLGIPGLVLGLTFFALGVRSVWRGIRSGENAVLCVGLLAAAVAALAHGLIDVSYALPDLMLVWVFLFGVAEVGDVPSSHKGISQ